jgi:hypothetical protein
VWCASSSIPRHANASLGKGADFVSWSMSNTRMEFAVMCLLTMMGQCAREPARLC